MLFEELIQRLFPGADSYLEDASRGVLSFRLVAGADGETVSVSVTPELIADLRANFGARAILVALFVPPRDHVYPNVGEGRFEIRNISVFRMPPR